MLSGLKGRYGNLLAKPTFPVHLTLPCICQTRATIASEKKKLPIEPSPLPVKPAVWLFQDRMKDSEVSPNKTAEDYSSEHVGWHSPEPASMLDPRQPDSSTEHQCPPKQCPKALWFPTQWLGLYALWKRAATHIPEEPSGRGLTGNLSVSSQGWTLPLTWQVCGPGRGFQDTAATLCLLFLEAPRESAPSSVLNGSEKGEQCCREISHPCSQQHHGLFEAIFPSRTFQAQG